MNELFVPQTPPTQRAWTMGTLDRIRWTWRPPWLRARSLRRVSLQAAGTPPEESPPSSWAERRPPPVPNVQSHVHKVSLSTVPGSTLPSQSTKTKPSVDGGGFRSLIDSRMQILCKYRPKSCLPTMLSCSMFFFFFLPPFFVSFFSIAMKVLFAAFVQMSTTNPSSSGLSSSLNRGVAVWTAVSLKPEGPGISGLSLSNGGVGNRCSAGFDLESLVCCERELRLSLFGPLSGRSEDCYCMSCPLV